MNLIWASICRLRLLIYEFGDFELYLSGAGNVAAISAHSLRNSLEAGLLKLLCATASAPYMPGPISIELR